MCAGSVPSNQEPLREIAMGTTSYLLGSRFAITDWAEASETSCSPERPPKTSPTRSFCCACLCVSVIVLSFLKHWQHGFHLHTSRPLEQYEILAVYLVAQQIDGGGFGG